MLLCVLTVSDRCSQGLMTDTAGPAVADLLRQHWPTARVANALVPEKERRNHRVVALLALPGRLVHRPA